ncbi:nitrate transporter 1.11, NRT1/ PTR family 1.2 [Hibiscus trionum]|uniref:Nitrate transporter 1.11, NRT1/ PTR family 1.2 n=1 Tax=Hibiscus trionum TaxID=183268 RepID=A0A9W7IEU2_HIBTR|nr:nitrate transporter 1.11, NRT1/ PTR family 1.2 [Hibiscus trionum]
MEKGVLQNSSKMPKGGFITLPFIIANEVLEKVPSYALVPTMMIYLRCHYHMTIAAGHTLINNWQAFTNFAPILGAFFADSYMGRFITIGLGSVASFLGVGILWLTTLLPQTRPPPCDSITYTTCESATPGQMVVLVCALFFKSIGAGGIRPCSMPFGADQLSNTSKKNLESYFGWYYAAASLGGWLGLTVLVYVIQTYGWKVGYGVCTFLMFLATVVFYIPSTLYVKQKASTSLFTGFVQVLVVSYKNRKLPLPSESSGYHHGPDSQVTVPSEKLRFLNKACIIRYADGSDGPTLDDPWRVCTAQKVEELKALLKVIPIWSTGIMKAIAGSQHLFPVLQASTMNRHIVGGFEIPAASLTVVIYLTVMVWIVLYERAIIPLASKIKGKQVYLSVYLRMGLGLFLTVIAMGLTAMVENVRLHEVNQEFHIKYPTAMVNMSAMWLLPQYIVMGIAEALSTLGQFEFYHRVFPKTMSSIGNSLFFLSLSMAHLLNSALFNIVNRTTARDGQPSWVADNINEAHYDYYYWLLAGLSLLNVFYYIICSRCYESTSDVVDEDYVSEDEL